MSASESKAQAVESGLEPLLESVKDDHETLMTYNESARVPWWVVAVWVIAIIGFVGYLVKYLFPDLALWGSP